MPAAHRSIRHVTTLVAVVAVVALVAASCINNGTWTAHPPADTTQNTPVFSRQLLSVSCPSTTFCRRWERAYIVCRPHSVLSRPAQRPERGSSGSVAGTVQGMQPIDR